jgi:hypothetical protein
MYGVPSKLPPKSTGAITSAKTSGLRCEDVQRGCAEHCPMHHVADRARLSHGKTDDSRRSPVM